MEIKDYHFPFAHDLQENTIPEKGTITQEKIEGYKKAVSIILAPGMPALCAPEKPHLALISSSQLTEPPDCKIILTFWALDLNGWHGPFLALLLNDHNLVLGAHLLGFHLVTCFNLPDIPAFPALELTPR
jgi:hypothetical protein